MSARSLLILAGFLSSNAIAAPTIDPQFGSHAVIQRGKPIVLSGSASTDWGNCPAFATVANTGTLSVTGGILHYISSVGITAITLNDESTLNLSNVTATDGSRPLLLSVSSLVGKQEDHTLRGTGSLDDLRDIERIHFRIGRRPADASIFV